MGWFMALAGIVLLLFLIHKTIDRETARNFKRLGKVVAILVGLIVISVFLSYISR